MDMPPAYQELGDGRAIVPVDARNRPQVNAFIEKRWLGTLMVVRGQPVDMTLLDGFALYEQAQIVGLITFALRGRVCKIVSLDSVRERTGVGAALLARVLDHARQAGCTAVRLSTTNDNVAALRFYQRRGFDIRRIRRNAMRKVRALKPGTPLTGFHGIPLKHELDLEYLL